MVTEKELESGAVQKYSLIYGYQASDTEKNTLTITEEGEVQACIELAQTGRLPRELGWFHLTLSNSDPDLAALSKIFKEKILIGGEAISRPLVDGKRYRTFHFKGNGEERYFSLFVEEPVPEPLADVMTVISRLFERLEKSPLQTLAISVSFEPTQIKRGDELRVGIEFRAAGKFPVEFRNPAYSSSSGAVSLRMNLWRHAKGANGDLTHDYVMAMDLGKSEFLLNDREAVPSDKLIIRIAPGKSFRMHTKVRIPKLNPGIYTIEAIYFAGPEPEETEVNDNLIVGTYHADVREIQVK